MEEINRFFHEEHPLKLIDWEMILGIIGVDCCDDEGKSGGGAVGCDICEEPLSNGDSAYACIQCRFFVHKLCSQLPYTINLPSLYQHPLRIETFKNKDFGLTFCYVCSQRITRGFSYFVNEKDDKGVFTTCSNCCLVEFARKVEADAIKEEAKIKFEHKGHPQHPLTLKLRPGSFLCNACNAKDEGLFYECDNCDFWIHKSCATLAPTIHLPHHHPKHPLVLIFFPYQMCLKCTTITFYSKIDPRISAASEDVNSLLHFPMSEAFTNSLQLLHSENVARDDDETAEIYHWSHPDHPLILNVEEPQSNNIMPNFNSGEPIECAMRSPLSLAHRYCKGHEIPLTCPPVENHPEDFYCDICEEEMDPNLPLYHCHNHKSRSCFHLSCISRIDYCVS
ncbi:C1-like protein [Tanacetum coccineum]|uniref:C1-like protein n=1 Tax=Tanacetum coccineum TaxID=301880 RepID=A0ABQ5CCH7_9ASTR